MYKQKKKQRGITLISLVISIIVMLILAGVTLNAVIGDNGIINQSQNAVLAQKYATYKEAVELALNDTLTCSGAKMKDYISSLEDVDLNNFVIVNGKLAFIGQGSQEKEVAESLGIDTTLTENSSVSDIQTIVDEVLTLSDTVEIPDNDSTVTPDELVGVRLYDKNAENGERWNIVIDYNDENQEKGRYGSNYYLLEAGNYTVNGETIIVTGNYIVNYETKSIIGLTDNYVEWSLDSTLAITEELVLNIDPTNLADGEWTGITKHGDVEYDATTKALKFNEDSVNNPTGEGGYLELTRSGIDFTDGFTFEIYANLSRIAYNNGSGIASGGLFCRMPSLDSNPGRAMRFGYDYTNGFMADVANISSWVGTGNVLSTNSTGDIKSNNGSGYSTGEDFYLTLVYTAYDSTKSAEYQEKHYDEKMIAEGIDKVEYYVNGELFGYTYYGHDSYMIGLDTWNTDECPFFLGICPWNWASSLYYLKGSVYTTRLYTYSMTSEEVSANRDMTERYRESF